jgi:hypothetical protein
MNADKPFFFIGGQLVSRMLIGSDRTAIAGVRGRPELGSSENAMRTTCFQSLAGAPLVGRDKGDAAAFSCPGMSGPAHGRFRFVAQSLVVVLGVQPDCHRRSVVAGPELGSSCNAGARVP